MIGQILALVLLRVVKDIKDEFEGAMFHSSVQTRSRKTFSCVSTLLVKTLPVLGLHTVNAVNRAAVVTGHVRENVLAQSRVQRQEKKCKMYHALLQTVQVGSTLFLPT